ncbi:hypothetical protein Btru_033554 [Bulinus truncatus]|nr:hypothetical protein Btru_033554 [Bulinus truncatus]
MLYFIVLLTIITSRTSQAYDWFGPNNNLRCHCTTDCNSEGVCVNNGTCISGWFGIKCQYQNIANKGTFNPQQYSSILNDGDNATCINDSSLQSLEVKWNKSYPLTWLRLVVKDQSSQNVVISYKETNLSNEVICLNQKLLWIDANTVDIQCKLQNTIQQLKISGDIVQSICELDISGGRNVALKGTAEQHTTFSTCDAHLAVDGSTDTYYSNCAQTADGDLYPYWRVQLQNSIAVNRYVIFNRDCPAGFWGMKCTSKCDTKCSDSCIVDGGWCPIQTNCLGFTNPPIVILTGSCFAGCGEGYQLPKCQKACELGQYGRNCSFNCSTLCTDRKCDAVNGSCFTCLPGYQGTLCENSCPNKTWGNNCTSVCNVNCLSGMCDGQTGLCTSGCDSGYQGPDCTQTCDKYSFGLNCSQTCSNYCLAGTCKHESGECNSCFPGYHGTYCTLIFEKNSTEEISWQKYFGIGFGVGVGSLITVQAIILVIVYFRCRRSKGSNPKKCKEQVYNQPEMFHMDKHNYETVDKSETRVDKQYENIGDTTDFE